LILICSSFLAGGGAAADHGDSGRPVIQQVPANANREEKHPGIAGEHIRRVICPGKCRMMKRYAKSTVMSAQATAIRLH